jgi:hypothetical protein
MVKLIKRLLAYLFYIEDEPNSTFNRRWRYCPQIGFYNGRFYIGLGMELIQFEGKPVEPHLVSYTTLQFIYNPKKWMIGQDHIYYDGGPHCHYQFGPFAWNENWRWCKKCAHEIEI